MLRKAASRACGTLASRLQRNGSLLQNGFSSSSLRHGRLQNNGSLPENGFHYRFFSTLRQGTRPCFAPSASHAVPIPPRRTLTQLYLYLLAKHPILTKSLTASTIYAFAGVTCQGIYQYKAKSPEEYPWKVTDTLLLAAIGLVFTGPALHFWFNFASRVIPARNLMSTFKKIVLEQVILGPITFAACASVLYVFKGKTIFDIASHFESLLPNILGWELLYWPVCAFITYHHVPVHLQPLVRNSFHFLWAICVTYMVACQRKVEAVH